MNMMERLKKTSTIKDAAIMVESKFFEEEDLVSTPIPAINIALSGDVNGGFGSGLISWCGPSKHFKTCFTLIMVKAYLDKHSDGVCIFFDSEFGASNEYFASFGIDTGRVFHIPILNIEELKFEIMKQLEEIKRNDHVIIALDSLGNLASLKEIDDALNEKSTADMTRAKQIKSLFRMVNPILSVKNIPMVIVNHTYKQIGCLESNTKIQTVNGNIPIKDIKIGDKVYTNNGVETVEYVYKPKEIPTHGKKYLKVNFDDGTSVNCTDNHEFLDVNENWIKAGDFTTETLLM